MVQASFCPLPSKPSGRLGRFEESEKNRRLLPDSKPIKLYSERGVKLSLGSTFNVQQSTVHIHPYCCFFEKKVRAYGDNCNSATSTYYLLDRTT